MLMVEYVHIEESIFRGSLRYRKKRDPERAKIIKLQLADVINAILEH